MLIMIKDMEAEEETPGLEGQRQNYPGFCRGKNLNIARGRVNTNVKIKGWCRC